MNKLLLEDIKRIKRLMSLNEGEVQFDYEEKKIIDEFKDFVVKDLGIKNNVDIKLQDNKEGIKTTGAYHYKEKESGDEEGSYDDSVIRVLCFGRALVDILRTIAHELTHHKQNEDGDLVGANTSPTSPVEKEATEEAGRLVKEFGKTHPEIYKSSEGESNQTEMTEDDESPEPSTSSTSTSSSSDSGGGGSTSNVTKWETGLTRGPANQITITIWTDNVSRGPANTIDNSIWDSGISRGKANTLF
jgi:hypothetical protein